MSENICLSGGAQGADKTFGDCAEKLGHRVKHFSFHGHKTPCKNGVIILDPLSLYKNDKMLIEANKFLKRQSPIGRSEYVTNLLRRNCWQIIGSERIYAVSYLDKHDFVGGGTGWAVMMGVQAGIKELYLFDHKLDKWFIFQGFDTINPKFIWNEMEILPPVPHGIYTGIGSHDLPDNGKNAIEELYK